MKDLKVASQVNGSVMEILLEGSINETTDLSVVPLEGIEELFIDFNAVSFINSTGINKWIQWTNDLEQNHAKVTANFSNCPKIIIDQINSVKGFLPSTARVESFWLPFYCDESDRHEYVLLTRGKDFMEENTEGEEWVKIPDCNCAETQTPCEPDIMPAKYFAFLKGKRT